mmetsp:Transcript_24933/g.28857  ORF Transcript_24933/g.28857 Transcript_24933/m.28857 type:complete len:94 (+) Transcript_24933:482-763(+)
MCGCDNQRTDQAGHKDRRNPNGMGKQAQQDGIMDEQGIQAIFGTRSFLLHTRNGDLDGIKAPQGKQGRKGNKENPMLNPSNGGITFGIRHRLV